MTEERDPMLQKLFAEADRELDSQLFINGVMTRVRRQRYQSFAGIAAIGLFATLLAWLALPLQEIAVIISQLLTTSLIDLGEGWLTFVLAPINNVASILIIAGKLARMGWKRIVSASYVN